MKKQTDGGSLPEICPLLILAVFSRFNLSMLGVDVHHRAGLSHSFLPATVDTLFPKALCKWVVVDFKLRDAKVLVCGHSHELRLGKGEGQALRSHLHRLVCFGQDPVRERNDVELRNVPVHGVQNDVTVLVLEVIGQFELVEGHQAAHPVRALTRRVVV